MPRRDDSLRLAPTAFADYRELARRRLPRQLFDYVDGGAFSEHTMAANVADLHHVMLRQRILRDVSSRSTATTVLGQPLALPLLLAPVGFAGMFAPRAEVLAARAAERTGVTFVESTLSICSVEEVAASTSHPVWFQLYVMRDRGYAEELLARATAANCSALVLTVDLAVPGRRLRDGRNGLHGDLRASARARRALDLASHPRWVNDVARGGKPLTFGNLERAVPEGRVPQDFQRWVAGQFDASVSWDDLAWLRDHWKGPIVLKGILDPDDARESVAHGADAIIVSNHGGRQLDDVVSTARALDAIVQRVGGELEVLMDGGVQSGLDVAKALALGARACLIGRAWVYGVAAHGEQGVVDVIESIRADLHVALALTGVRDVASFDRGTLETVPWARPSEER